MKKIYLITAILFIAISAKTQDKKLKNSKTEEIVFLHTNDIHGSIANFARLAFIVDSIRAIYKNVYLLNAGDLFTGNPMVDMSEEKGYAVIDLMNKVGFNVSAIGNHEFDYGQEVLKKRIGEANFPFICANIINENGIIKIPEPYIKLKTKGNLNITILSILDNSANGYPETHPSKLKGLKFPDPIPTILKYKKLAKKSDLFIALTHLGIENDKVLAAQMPEIDLIIGGHSHTVIDSILLVNGVMIAQAGSKLKSVGEIKLSILKGKIIDRTYKLISLKGKQNINPEINDLVYKYSQNPLLKEVLGKAKTKLAGNEELGCFYTDALRNTKQFDIVFQNSGGIRINEIPEGDITLETIYKMDPFGNYLMSVNMKTDEIRSLITYSFRNHEIELRVSGINYTIVKENNSIKEILLTDYQGNPIDENKTYNVGMNDYILSTYQFKHNDKGSSQGVTTAEVVMEYLKKVGEIDYKGVKRAFLKDLDVKN